MTNIIGAIISGLVIGLIAQFLFPGAATMGWIAIFALRIGGSLLASFAVSGGRGGFQSAGCLASIPGAIALILIGWP